MSDARLVSWWDEPMIIIAFIISSLGNACGLQLLKQVTGRGGRSNHFRLATASLSLATTGAWVVQLFILQLLVKPPSSTIVSMDLLLSLVGEVGLVLCLALAFYVLAADGATNRRVILCAMVCGLSITGMAYLVCHSLVVPATMTWDSRVVIGSVFIGMFALVVPLVLFFRVQSHFRLTYIIHGIASLLLALGMLAIQLAVVSALSITGVSVPSSTRSRDVSLTHMSWLTVPASCFSLLLLTANCLSIRKAAVAETSKTRSLLLSCLIFDNNNRVLTTIVGSLPSVEMDKVPYGAFGAYHADFLKMLTTSFDWRKARKDALLKLVRNKRRVYSLELFVKFVNAAAALSRTLKVDISELGVMYGSPITLRASNDGVMVTLCKRVTQPAHYSALGPFKWTSLDLAEQALYETYSFAPLPPPTNNTNNALKSDAAYTMDVPLSSTVLASPSSTDVKVKINDTHDEMDNDDRANAPWVRSMQHFLGACDTPTQPGVYLAMLHVRIAGTRVETLLQRDCLHLPPAVRITSQLSQPSGAEWEWVQSLSDASHESHSWTLADSRRMAQLPPAPIPQPMVSPPHQPLTPPLHLHSAMAHASTASSNGLLSPKSPERRRSLFGRADHHSSTSNPNTGRNNNGGGHTERALMLPLLKDSHSFSATTPHMNATHNNNNSSSNGIMISRPPSSAGTSARSTYNSRPSTAHHSHGHGHGHGAHGHGVGHGSAFITPGVSVSMAASSTMAILEGNEDNTSSASGAAGSPIHDEPPLRTFQRNFFTAANGLASLLGTDADLLPKNIYHKPIIASLRGDIKLILLVTSKMHTGFPDGYARDTLRFRPVSVFEAIHRARHARRAPLRSPTNLRGHQQQASAAANPLPSPVQRPASSMSTNGPNGALLSHRGINNGGSDTPNPRASPPPMNHSGPTLAIPPLHTPTETTKFSASSLFASAIGRLTRRKSFEDTRSDPGATAAQHGGGGPGSPTDAELMASTSTAGGEQTTRSLPSQEQQARGSGNNGTAPTTALGILTASNHGNGGTGTGGHNSTLGSPTANGMGKGESPPTERMIDEPDRRGLELQVPGHDHNGIGTTLFFVPEALLQHRSNRSFGRLPPISADPDTKTGESTPGGGHGRGSGNNGASSSAAGATADPDGKEETKRQRSSTNDGSNGAPAGAGAGHHGRKKKIVPSAAEGAKRKRRKSKAQLLLLRESKEGKFELVEDRTKDVLNGESKDMTDSPNINATNGNGMIMINSNGLPLHHIAGGGVTSVPGGVMITPDADVNDIARPDTMVNIPLDDDTRANDGNHHSRRVLNNGNGNDGEEEDDEEYEKSHWLKEVMATLLMVQDEKKKDHLNMLKLKHDIIASSLIRDRRYHLRTFRNVLMGSSLVDWLIKEGHAIDRTTAVTLGERLFDYGLRPAQQKEGSHNHATFRDQPVFFTFAPKEVVPNATTDERGRKKSMYNVKFETTNDGVKGSDGKTTGDDEPNRRASMPRAMSLKNDTKIDINGTTSTNANNNGDKAAGASSATATAAANGIASLANSADGSTLSLGEGLGKDDVKSDIGSANGNGTNGEATVIGDMDGTSGHGTPHHHGHGRRRASTDKSAPSDRHQATFSNLLHNETKTPETRVLTFVELKAAIMAADLIADRRMFLQQLPQSLIGSQLVDWLVARHHASDRTAAMIVSQELVSQNMLHPVPYNPAEPVPTFHDSSTHYYSFQLPPEPPVLESKPSMFRALSRAAGGARASIQAIAIPPPTPLLNGSSNHSNHSPNGNTVTTTADNLPTLPSNTNTNGATAPHVSPKGTPLFSPSRGSPSALPMNPTLGDRRSSSKPGHSHSLSMSGGVTKPSSNIFQPTPSKAMRRTSGAEQHDIDLATMPQPPQLNFGISGSSISSTGPIMPLLVHTASMPMTPSAASNNAVGIAVAAGGSPGSRHGSLVHHGSVTPRGTSIAGTAATGGVRTPTPNAGTVATGMGVLPVGSTTPTSGGTAAAAAAPTTPPSTTANGATMNGNNNSPAALAAATVIAAAAAASTSATNNGTTSRGASRHASPTMVPIAAPPSPVRVLSLAPSTTAPVTIGNGTNAVSTPMSVVSGPATPMSYISSTNGSPPFGAMTMHPPPSPTVMTANGSIPPSPATINTTITIPSSPSVANGAITTLTNGTTPSTTSSMVASSPSESRRRMPMVHIAQPALPTIQEGHSIPDIANLTPHHIKEGILAARGTLIADRWRGLTQHHDCIVGCELVSWFIAKGYAWDRHSGLVIGRRMYGLGLRDVDDHGLPFMDTQHLYTFAPSRSRQQNGGKARKPRSESDPT